MRIALLEHTSDATSVGSDGFVPGLRAHARALAELGHSVHVFAAANPHGTTGSPPDAAPANRSSIDGAQCTFFARDGALRRALIGRADFALHRITAALADASDALAGLRQQLKTGGFDVVEIVGDAAAAGLVALCSGVPAVVRVLHSWPRQGSTVERFAAARLAQIGLRSARAVNVPSNWLRNQLARKHVFDGPAVVAMDGLWLPAGVEVPAGGDALHVWCDSDRKTTELETLLERVVEAHPGLHITVAGPRFRHEQISSLRSRFASAADGSVPGPSAEAATTWPLTPHGVGLIWLDHAPACPTVLLQAMACGLPVAAPRLESVPEALRHDIDGLLFESSDAAARQLERLLGDANLRTRLANAARERVAKRFDPLACARRRLQVYDFAVGGRPTRPTDPTIPAATMPWVELGPDNWFDAWWIAGSERRPTRLARDGNGQKALLGLPRDELKLVEAMLLRTWCDGPRDWSAPEWSELREFEGEVLDRLEQLRKNPAGQPTDAAAQLTFPPTEHPMFAADQSAVFLDELWRLERPQRLSAWLEAALLQRQFVARAVENVNLRRIAVEAATRTPTAAIFDVLRRLYRDAKRHARVVADDRLFLSNHGDKRPFARGIAELGLHAPLTRPQFSIVRRTRRGKPAVDAPPRVTVLIPSYRHEAFIELAIESCLRQSIRDLRVLVVDDVSPDGTVAAARSIQDPRLQVDVNAANLGLGSSILSALSRIDTPFVALLNSDDLFHPERLERCLAAFDSDPNASIVASRFAVVDRRGCVLTHDTSCAVEIGPAAHAWLRWLDGIVRTELHRPEDWTSFQLLLRHNVLATSSNMVFRTDWLRRHMPEASRLKYCVDWQLFLRGAMEGSLRMIDAPLLAYRLHDANTVWFRDGGRADYVLEVNRVVDRVLGHWMQETVQREGAATAVTRLAELLEQDVRLHGETDGLALYLSDLAHRYADGAVDATAAPLAALADAALRRKTFHQVQSQLDVDPWSLPWRSRLADGWRLEHDVADGLGARVRTLHAENARLRLDLGTRDGELSDLRAVNQRIEQDHAATRRQAEAERARLHAAAAAAEQQAKADFAAACSRYEAALREEEAARRASEAQAAALSTEVSHRDAAIAALQLEAEQRGAEIGQLAATVEGLSRQLEERHGVVHELRIELERVSQANEALRDALARVTAEREALRQNIDELEARGEVLGRDLESVRGILARTQEDLERARADLAQSRDELARTGESLAQTRSELARTGETLTQTRGDLSQTRVDLSTARAELKGREHQVAALDAERNSLRTQLAKTTEERNSARDDARREARLRDRAIGSVLAERSALVAKANSPSWRLGDTLMRRVGVLQFYKTTTAWLRQLSAVTQRGGLHLRRMATPAGRAHTATVVFADSRADGTLDARCLHLADDVRTIGWAGGLLPGEVRAADRALLDRAHRAGRWLPDDSRLDAADRAYFAKRNATGVDEIAQRFGTMPWLGRVWRGVRLAKTLGAGTVMVQGLGCGAVAAYAAKRLCGTRLVLRLGDEDLLVHPLGNEAATLLRAADLLVVDSDLLLQTIERTIGSTPGRISVRWAIATEDLPPVQPTTKGIRAFVHWPAGLRADPATLVEGVRQAVAAGCDVTVDVVGGLGEGPAGFRRWLAFLDHLDTTKMAARFRLHGPLSLAARRQVQAAADLALWIGRAADGAGLPEPVVEAFAIGRPVIASAVRELTWLPALAENADLVAPGEPGALARALQRFAEDRGPAMRRLADGRRLMGKCSGADEGGVRGDVQAVSEPA